jgi:3-oxoadipate enol-lactonase
MPAVRRPVRQAAREATMPTLTTGGAELYYETHGSGPAIVFAHGAGGNHLSWYQQVPYFRGRYTCVTFDHRGFGRSVDPRPVEQRPRFDEDLAALIDHLGLADVRLVAQSMGGWTCLGYAVTHPERVRALVMADTPGGLTSPEMDAARAAANERRGNMPLLGGALSQKFRDRDPVGAFLYEQIFGLNPPRDQALGGGTPMNRLAVSAEQAAKLAMPVLFIEGEDDILLPPDVIRVAQSMIPGARLTMVADAGHSVYFEKPDEFNRVLDGFLAEVDKGVPVAAR